MEVLLVRHGEVGAVGASKRGDPPLADASRGQARALVVSHGGLLSYLVQLLLGQEPRDDATIGFECCAVARVIAYREDPAFGPFAMLRFDAR